MDNLSNIFYFPPNTLTFIVTYNCTSSCPNCCFKCNPKRKEKLTTEEIISVIDFLSEHYNSLKTIVLTGGEPFTLEDDLVDIISYISSKNLNSRIVTNAFWANNYEIAYSQISKLKQAGLSEINFSTGDEHLKFTPYDNIVFATMASLDNNISVAINVESSDNKTFKSTKLYNDHRLSKYLDSPDKYPLFKILNGTWVYLNTESNSTCPSTPLQTPHSEACTSMLGNICLSPNMEYLACCGFGNIYNKYLNIGHVNSQNITQIYNAQFDDIIKIWLYTEGPLKIAEWINKSSNNPISIQNKHSCEICNTILSDTNYITFLKQNIKHIYSNIVLKYTTKSKVL
ncbi:MAG: radical SAM protein [Tannerellaceae bacterium]